MNQNILLVEDDRDISNMIRDALLPLGFSVTAAFNGEEALAVFDSGEYDLILLDLMIPKLDGLECLKIIRSKSMVPVLILSAKSEDVDKVLGLGFGADDYLTKPFSMMELTARLNAMLRRETHYIRLASQKDELKESIIQAGDLTVDLNTYSVKKSGRELKLTLKEFNLLKQFMTKRTQVFTKAQLYSLIWQEEYYGDENVINVHIRRLREKIEDDPSNPKYIQTVWGIGYKLGDM